MFYILSPLEQFQLDPLISFFIKYFPIIYSFLIVTNAFVFFIIIFFILFFLFYVYYKEPTIIPKYFQYIFEIFFNFLKNMIIENIGIINLKYFNYIFTMFFFIFLANICGMVPYSFAITSHLIVTFAASFFTFFGINLIGIQKWGQKFLELFLPNGAPLQISPFIILVEFISYFARLFSLAIRLFANVMAGHTLLKILAGFSYTMLLFGNLGLIMFIFPMIITFIVIGLEIAIACLQAYVFSILICIYLNDALNLH